MTLAEGAWLSSTIRSFSTVVHRRRRSGPDRTETLLTFAHLLANQSANYRRQGCRPEGGPHRKVTSRHDAGALDVVMARTRVIDRVVMTRCRPRSLCWRDRDVVVGGDAVHSGSLPRRAA
jgi:hypothetical protein